MMIRILFLVLVSCSFLVGKAGAGSVGEMVFLGTGDVGIKASVGKGDLSFSAERFACATCHGRDGQGGGEGALAVPAITWEVLSVSNDERPGYDLTTFRQILAEGVRSNGKKADMVMPRYATSVKQAEDLAGFLTRLSQREKRGVSATGIRILIPHEAHTAALAEQFAMGLSQAVSSRRPWGRTIDVDLLPVGSRTRFPDLLEGENAPFIMAGSAVTRAEFQQTIKDGAVIEIAPLGPAWEADNRYGRRLVCSSMDEALRQLARKARDEETYRLVLPDELWKEVAEAAFEAVLKARPMPAETGRKPTGEERVVVVSGTMDRLPDEPVLGIAEHLLSRIDDLSERRWRSSLVDSCGGLASVEGLDKKSRAQALGFVAGHAILTGLERAGRQLTGSAFLSALDNQPILLGNMSIDMGARRAQGGLSPTLFVLGGLEGDN